MWFLWQILSLLNRMVMITAHRFFFNGWSSVENWGGGQMHVYGWRAWLKRSWKQPNQNQHQLPPATAKLLTSALEPVWYSVIPWTISQSRQTWLWSFCSTFTKRLTLNSGPGPTCMTSYPVECACWSIIIRAESIARWQRPKIWT